MTKQEIYNKVKNHLLTQFRKAMNRKGECSYRGEDGTMCAAGCLIKDEHYDIEIEGGVVLPYSDQGKLVCNALIKSGVAEEDLEFVRELQLIHDTDEPKNWKGELEHTAHSNNLEP